MKARLLRNKIHKSKDKEDKTQVTSFVVSTRHRQLVEWNNIKIDYGNGQDIKYSEEVAIIARRDMNTDTNHLPDSKSIGFGKSVHKTEQKDSNKNFQLLKTR